MNWCSKVRSISRTQSDHTGQCWTINFSNCINKKEPKLNLIDSQKWHSWIQMKLEYFWAGSYLLFIFHDRFDSLTQVSRVFVQFVYSDGGGRLCEASSPWGWTPTLIRVPHRSFQARPQNSIETELWSGEKMFPGIISTRLDPAWIVTNSGLRCWPREGGL